MVSKIRYASLHSNKIKRDLKSISWKTARNFLLKWGYTSSSFLLPEYYKSDGFNGMKLDPINWKNSKGVKITKTLDILTPKSCLSWRSFNFLNPYTYRHIAYQLTEKNHWQTVRSLLTRNTLVHVYSLPIFSLRMGETVGGKSISNWIQMAERDLIKDCPEYSHLIITDIKNFYPTVYTHSISWSIHSKEKIKQPNFRYDYNLLGNKLDKLFRNSRDGQTNGIPVGSMVSDVIAEIILADVDNELSSKIKKSDISDTDILIFRYRDDYRILSRSEEQGKIVLQFLNKILQSKYGLHLNADKTVSHADVIEGSFRSWVVDIKGSHLLRQIYYEELPKEGIKASYLKDCLVETYRIQKKHLNGRVSTSILSKLSNYLDKEIQFLNIKVDDILEIIAILRKMTLLREEVTPQVILLLDILLRKVDGKTEKKRILCGLKQVLMGKEDHDYQLIWFYRLCLSQLPEMCENILNQSKSPLLRVLDKKYYKEDFDMFEASDFSSNDMRELRKFSLIDRRRLKELNSKHISPFSLNIFKY